MPNHPLLPAFTYEKLKNWGSGEKCPHFSLFIDKAQSSFFFMFLEMDMLCHKCLVDLRGPRWYMLQETYSFRLAITVLLLFLSDISLHTFPLHTVATLGCRHCVYCHQSPNGQPDLIFFSFYMYRIHHSPGISGKAKPFQVWIHLRGSRIKFTFSYLRCQEFIFIHSSDIPTCRYRL